MERLRIEPLKKEPLKLQKLHLVDAKPKFKDLSQMAKALNAEAPDKQDYNGTMA